MVLVKIGITQLALSVILLGHSPTSSFAPSSPICNHRIFARSSRGEPPHPSTLPLYFFGTGNNKKDGEDDADPEEAKDTDAPDASEEEGRSRPFFGRLLNRNKDKKDAAQDLSPSSQEKATNSGSRTTQTSDPTELAKTLRAQAEKARLEAARMEGELNLERIERLAQKISQAKKKGESVEESQRDLDDLQAKLRGEAPKPRPKADETESIVRSVRVDDLAPKTPSGDWDERKALLWGDRAFDQFLETIQAAPSFEKMVIARMVGLDFDTADDVNATELAKRLAMMAAGDLTYSSQSKQSWTPAQINEMVGALSLSSDLEGVNATELAIYALDYDFYVENKVADSDSTREVSPSSGERIVKQLESDLNVTPMDATIEGFFPKCMRKEGAEEPTMAQIQSFVANVLPQTKFKAVHKPEKVSGGYIVRGTHNYENGDELIAAIDKETVRTNLGDKMTVLYINDFNAFDKAIVSSDDLRVEDVEDMNLFEERTPILYITSTDLCREPKPVILSATTALGLATSWYLSIYPFLLNPTLSKRIEEQLAVADAGMVSDLDWLTELSLPLFLAFLGIQLVHELAHGIAAAAHGTKISVPTLVPSLITGTTSTVTTFKAPPKNKEAMFDFALAGPMGGIAASVVALVAGCQLTANSNPELLPALPLEILRQSTLGGGIIDSMIPGTLYVPEGAPMQGIMVSLHPLAIAGYISLVVNALALLPVGTTDGGRITQVLLGRLITKESVGTITLATLLFTGLLGSDLFLFYFAFIIAFQTGNEVAARNEVDDVSLPRVVAATAGFALAFLSLVPFQ